MVLQRQEYVQHDKAQMKNKDSKSRKLINFAQWTEQVSFITSASTSHDEARYIHAHRRGKDHKKDLHVVHKSTLLKEITRPINTDRDTLKKQSYKVGRTIVVASNQSQLIRISQSKT